MPRFTQVQIGPASYCLQVITRGHRLLLYSFICKRERERARLREQDVFLLVSTLMVMEKNCSAGLSTMQLKKETERLQFTYLAYHHSDFIICSGYFRLSVYMWGILLAYIRCRLSSRLCFHAFWEGGVTVLDKFLTRKLNQIKIQVREKVFVCGP